jgi:glycosyltransferase involved in cell wall biosynthesis
VGGIAEPVRRFGAGIVVAAGDIEALAEALRTVLSDPDPFRAGAGRARDDLTWAEAARAHIRLYEEIA